MSHEDRKVSRVYPWESGDAEELNVRHSGHPGKQTPTMSLPPRPANIRSAVQAPVQQKADSQRKTQPSLAEQWMNVALRPDLHDPPVQRKRGEEGGKASLAPPSGGTGQDPDEIAASNVVAAVQQEDPNAVDMSQLVGGKPSTRTSANISRASSHSIWALSASTTTRSPLPSSRG